MTQAFAASYGTWVSPISADKVGEAGVRFSNIESHEGDIYWVESRPLEKGRSALVRASDKKTLVPEPFSVRTTVHEYGGKSFAFHDKTLYFVNFADQHLYKQTPGENPTLLIDAPSKRFADFVVHPNGKWLYSILENHEDPSETRNSLVKIDLETKEIETLREGHDFYAAPRISPDGKKLAYIFWDHPNMPWDGTELWVIDLNSQGSFIKEEKIAGGLTESIVEPLWSPENKLFYATDKSGYWNIFTEGKAIFEKEADFSYPLWNLGQKHYDFFKHFIVAIYTEKAVDSLALIDLKTKKMETLNLPYTRYDQISVQGDELVMIAASPTEPAHIISVNPTTKKVSVLHKPYTNTIDKKYFSLPKTVEFPTTHKKQAYLFYYPPTNPDYTAPASEKPPLVVFVHGGPTSHVTPTFQLAVQYWTSRGFAVADINYGGSSGYGREYRNRLSRHWGFVDIDDCCNAALYLFEEGLADKNRAAIRGGSAGGYTTLAALTFRYVFQVGASYYGVTDLELLAQDTGKFESHYLDGLIGKYPEEKARYHALSPLHHIDKLKYPVLLLQGTEDKVVPKEQAELFYNALLKKNIPTEYLLFEGEQHGFRKADTIKRSLEAEYAFYCRIFGISP